MNIDYLSIYQHIIIERFYLSSKLEPNGLWYLI